MCICNAVFYLQLQFAGNIHNFIILHLQLVFFYNIKDKTLYENEKLIFFPKLVLLC